MRTTALAAVYNKEQTRSLDILREKHGAADIIYSSLNAAYTST
jgi:hypothetical protein